MTPENSGCCRMAQKLKDAGCPKCVTDRFMAADGPAEKLRVLTMHRACLMDGGSVYGRELEMLNCLICSLEREYKLK